ncbi:hypothetical protein [Mucilaginibacter sp. PAMB04168]|uniref:hypothetical protein n=1 Tax=Mucilaginibacter sp. PAMB04168 TaxID=3138567 RepID=UPI0031F71470
MMTYRRLSTSCRIIFCLFTAVLLQACKQPRKTHATQQDTVTTPVKAPVLVPTHEAATDTVDDCPRGAAEPVIKKDIFPAATFTMQADHRTGIETLTFDDGDKLMIKQSGCEYYRLDFRFETSRFEADTTNVTYWSNTGLSLMRRAIKGLDTPLEIGKALNNLSARLEKDKSGSGTNLTLGEEIDFGGSDPRQYLTIDRITRLANQRYAIELSLSYGPI